MSDDADRPKPQQRPKESAEPAVPSAASDDLPPPLSKEQADAVRGGLRNGRPEDVWGKTDQ